MYFDGNESKTHLEAKEKLFDLIVSKRVKIVDQNGKQYEIFTGKYEDEFLHIESFIMDYRPEVIFSNRESPCKKFMTNKATMCDIGGYFGAFKELPCEKCVLNNFSKYMEGSSKFASYRPDVSFGYGGKHKIWLEIKNESPCSKNKIDFCKNNGIVLLEIVDMEVLRFKEFNGVLVFNRLEEYTHKVNIYEIIEIMTEYIEKNIKENRYVLYENMWNKFKEHLTDEITRNPRDIMKFTKILNDNYNKVGKYGKSKTIKDHFKLNKNIGTLLITKNEYKLLVDKGAVPDLEKESEEFKKKIEEVFLDYWRDNAHNGYILTQKFQLLIKDIGKINISELCDKIGYMRLTFRHKKDRPLRDKIRKLGIDIDDRHKDIIVKKEVVLMLSK